MMTNARRAAVLTALVVLGVSLVHAQDEEWERRHRPARDLVARVQSDLQRASGNPNPGEKDRERYDNAMRHLSEFDRSLVERRFDKGKLDAAVDDVKNVVEHNTLSVEDRDILGRDLRKLRELREIHDERTGH